MSRSWKIDRRTFLRGTAGALLQLPFLNLMEGKTFGIPSKPTYASPDDGPLRFLTLFKPNGVHPPSWNINGGTEFDFRTSPLMAPFAKHKDDLLILDNMGDFGFSSHANSTRRFLSGHHENKDSASIDQIIADHISGDTPHRSLELTTEGLFVGQFGCSYISYDKNGGAIPRESDPQLVFDRLFRNPMADADQRKKMGSLLDQVNGDAKILARSAGVEDRQTLDQYLTVVRETERRIQNMENSTTTPRIDFSTLSPPPLAGNLDEQVESMLDLIALALWTDSTRCASYMLGNSNSRMVFDFLGVTEQHHYLSHFFRNFSRSNIDGLLKISLWHMEKFDSLLTKLKSFREGSGTLLDNTVVLFGSGMGHSDNHTAQRIPIVLAGNAKGRLKTGRYLRYSQNQELSNLHVSLLNTFDVDTAPYSSSSQNPLLGLDGGEFDEFEERPFQTWVTKRAGHITVQGRLRMSDNLDEARVFYIDVKDQLPVKILIEFRDFHDYNLAYHVGTPIVLSGNGSDEGNQLLITKITDLKSLHGKSKPGSARG